MKKNILAITLFIFSLLIFSACTINISSSSSGNNDKGTNNEGTYLITYISTYGSKPENKTVSANYSLTAEDLPVLSQTGCTFKGWNKSVGDQITGNLTITASWELIEYTITYHTEAEDGLTGTPIYKYTIETETYILPKAVRTSKTFRGWFTNSSLTGQPATQINKGSTGNKEYWPLFSDPGYKVSWSSKIATQGSYLNTSNPPLYSNDVGSKEILYTDVYGNSKCVNPYKAGEIEVKKGTSISLIMYSSTHDSNLSYIYIGDNYVTGKSGYDGTEKKASKIVKPYTPEKDVIISLVSDIWNSEYNYYKWKVNIN